MQSKEKQMRIMICHPFENNFYDECDYIGTVCFEQIS